MKSRLITSLLVVAVFAAGCGTSTSSPNEAKANAVHAWVTATKFEAMVGDLQNDTAKIELATKRRLPVLTMQTLCGILLIDAQTANNDLPVPDRQVTALLGTAYGDLGAGANQCFNAGDVDGALMAKSVENRSKGLIALAQATSRLEALLGQPLSTTTTTTTLP